MCIGTLVLGLLVAGCGSTVSVATESPAAGDTLATKATILAGTASPSTPPTSQPSPETSPGPTPSPAPTTVTTSTATPMASTTPPPQPSPTLEPSDSPTPSPTPDFASSPAIPRPSDWTGLQWAAPVAFAPDAAWSVTDVTVWRRRLIAVGSIDDPTDNTFYRPHAAVWQSSDGLTWKRTFRYKRGGSVIQHVLPLNGASARADTARLVGIGTALNPPTDGGCGVIPDPDPIGVWTSPDGLAWQRQRQSSVFNGATIDAAASNGRIVLAVGDTGYLEPAIWITTDGQTWRREVLPKSLFRDAHLTDLAAVPGGWILGSHTLHEQSLGCVGPDNPDHAAAWFSADGLHWQTAAIHWPDNRVQHGDVRDFQVTAALISAGDFQSLDGGRRWTWNRATRLPFQPRAADGQRMILQAADPTSSNDNGAADDPLPFLASSNLTDWQSLAASGDVADMPSHRYNLDGLFVLPGGIVALGSANSDGSLRLWVAAAT